MSYYFIKQIKGREQQIIEDRLTMIDYHTSFNFLDRTNADKQSRIKEMLKNSEDISFLADIGAATLARLIKGSTVIGGNYVNTSLINEALQCCRSIISKSNYNSIALSDLHDIVPTHEFNIMLVAGAQDRSILESRIEAAYNCAKSLHNVSFTIALAGLQPPVPKQVRIRDEANEMKIMLESFINRYGLIGRHSSPKIINIESESESETTRQNIQKLYKKGELDANKINNIFIVSSTFHLARLAHEMETQIKENQKYKVGFVVLVGAEENCDSSPVTQSYKYVKAMFYEIYNYLLWQSKDKTIPFEKIP